MEIPITKNVSLIIKATNDLDITAHSVKVEEVSTCSRECGSFIEEQIKNICVSFTKSL